MLSQEIVAVIHPAGQDLMIGISYSATDLALVSFGLGSPCLNLNSEISSPKDRVFSWKCSISCESWNSFELREEFSPPAS